MRRARFEASGAATHGVYSGMASCAVFVGNITHMKETLHIDEKELQDAKSECGTSTDTETVRLDLEASVRQAAYQRLRKLRGTEKGAADIPRRRPGL